MPFRCLVLIFLTLPLLAATTSTRIFVWSPTRGLVTIAGQPLPNTRVRREARVRMNGQQKTYQDETTTDNAGRFAFNALNDIIDYDTFLDTQPVVHQRLYISVNDKEREGWRNTRTSFDEGRDIWVTTDQYIGDPLIFNCDMDRKPLKQRKFDGDDSQGLCIWIKKS